MTDDEKNLYENIVNACNSFLSSSADLTEKHGNDYILAYVPYSNFDLANAVNVSYAVYLSNPQFYFLEPTTTGYYGFSYAIAISIPKEFALYSNRKEYSDRIHTLTNVWMSEINSYDTDIEKERCIYKKLCDYIVYDKVGHHQTIAGTLANGKGVCNGYALAMSYFCSAAGIDNVFALSANHAWNRVKLDGKWYEVDVTWMDQKTYICGDWCNKSTSSFKNHVEETGSHTLDSRHTTLHMFALPDCTEDYPKCSPHINEIVKAQTCMQKGEKSNKCSMCYWRTSWNNEIIPELDHNYIWNSDDVNHWQECEYNCGTKKNLSSHTSNNVYLSNSEYHWQICLNTNCGKEFNKTEHNCINGICIECGYSKKMRGDVNNDGYVDNYDLLMLRAYLSDITQEYSTVYDINSDNYVDNLDLLILRNILSELTV